MTTTVLLCDLSNASYMKLALARPGERPEVATRYSCRSLEEFNNGVYDFLEAHGKPELLGAAIAGGGWETDGGLSMHNHGYRIERAGLRDVMQVQRIHIVNDCVAMAMGIQGLLPSEFEKVCGGYGEEGCAKVLVATGTGLGTAGVVFDDLDHAMILPCEGGHTDLPVTTPREAQVYAELQKRYDHVSRERAVSSEGLCEIYEILGLIDEGQGDALGIQEIIALAYTQDPRALEAVALCQGWLAATASDAALMLGARGGVYLSGGLMKLFADLLDVAAFEARFHQKGRAQGFVSDIPVYIINAEDIELIGLKTLFDH
jgi:glucokinase